MSALPFDIQSGTETFEGAGSVEVTFDRPFAKRPSVIIALSSFMVDLDPVGGFVCRVTADDVTEKGFTARFRPEGRPLTATASWIAHS